MRKKIVEKNSFTIVETIVAMVILFVMSGLFLKINIFQVNFERYNMLQDIENSYNTNYKQKFIYDKNNIKLEKIKIP
ncbi:MAG: hypothetical protein DRG11_00520 [Epsilonproteobacteria bacterium]|nr:MAG: hypothetical protein DRG11_00520 [Campylobacterota bacterium]